MRAACLAVAALLAACDDTPAPAPQPMKVVSARAEPRTNRSPDARYVGRWAARASECTTTWFRFWSDELRTGQPQARCDILPPGAGMGDERRRAVCVTDGAVSREEWVMAYPADGLMTLSRDGGAPVTLGKCT